MIIPLILILVIGLVAVVLYNSVIAKKNAVANAFGAIDAMLKKRYDLIPNLVETVKTYMNYERDTLTKITELRTKAIDPNIPADQKIQLENQIAAARRAYNAAVTDYNNAVQQFPTSIFAGMMKLTTKPVLEIPEEEREN